MAIIGDAIPVVIVAAALDLEQVDKDPERTEPGGCKNQVQRPSEEAAPKGKQAKQAEEGGESGNHLGVDESPLGPRISMAEVMEVGSDDAGYHLEVFSLCSAEAL